MVETLHFYGAEIDDLKKSVAGMHKSLGLVDELKAEVSRLRDSNLGLLNELNDIQQYSRGNNLEISGIPEEKNENIVALVSKIGVVVGCSVDESSIDACHRVKSCLFMLGSG